MPKPRDRALNGALRQVLTRLAESVTGYIELDAEDREAFGSEVIERLVSVGIVRAAGAATTVVCPGCEEACLRPVDGRTTESGHRPTVLCDMPQDYGVIDLDPRSLDRWRADFDDVAMCLGAVATSAAEPEVLVPGGLARLAHVSVDGMEVELLPAHRATPDLFDHPAVRHAVCALLLHLGPIPATALPTLELAEALTFEDGRLRLQTSRLAKVLLDAQTAVAGNVFHRNGAVWQVRYGDRTGSVAHVSGMSYITRLLEHPDRIVRAVDLYAAVRTGGRRLEQAGLEASDRLSRKELQKALSSIKAAVSDAEARGASDRASQLRRDLDRVQAQLKGDFGRSSRLRRTNDPADKARQNVRKAIMTALRQIEVAHPALHRHLRAAIQTGYECVYRPPQAVRWQINS